MIGIFKKRYELLLQELEQLKSSLTDVTKKEEEEHQHIDSSIGSLKNEIKRVDSSIGSLKNEIKRVERNILTKGLRYLNPFWQITYYESFKVAFALPDFSERYFALIRALDDESIETVTAIIARLQSNFEKTEAHWRIYTDKEKKLHERIYDELTSRIVQLSPDMFSYKNYILPCNEFDAGVFFFNYGLQYIKDITYTSGRHIIDAGAFIGDSLLLLSPLTSKQVHCFEAHPTNYDNLIKTVEMNNITNVSPVNIAVGGRDGEVVIRGREDRLPAVTLNAVPRYSVDESKKDLEFELTVPVCTLDSYVEQHELDIGLIKVDIEGAESEFLQGAKRTIQRDRPILLFSIYHTANDFLGIKPQLEEWNLGYSFKIIPGSGNILSGALLIADPTGR